MDFHYCNTDRSFALLPGQNNPLLQRRTPKFFSMPSHREGCQTTKQNTAVMMLLVLVSFEKKKLLSNSSWKINYREQ